MNYLFFRDNPLFLIIKSAVSATSICKTVLLEKGLTDVKPAYLGVLMCMWTKEGVDEMLSKLGSTEGMSFSELRRCAGIEPSTITGLIDRMERDGLVVRTDDPLDRRVQIARLTEKGIAIRETVMAAVDEMLDQALNGIRPDEIKITQKVLLKLLENAGRE